MPINRDRFGQEFFFMWLEEVFLPLGWKSIGKNEVWVFHSARVRVDPILSWNANEKTEQVSSMVYSAYSFANNFNTDCRSNITFADFPATIETFQIVTLTVFQAYSLLQSSLTLTVSSGFIRPPPLPYATGPRANK